MNQSQIIDRMVEDYCQSLSPLPTEIEKQEYRKLAQKIHDRDEISKVSQLQIKAYLSDKNLITRSIHCSHCHTSYYYDPDRGFDGRCYYCETAGGLELEEVLINRIPPWLDIKSYVWYGSS